MAQNLIPDYSLEHIKTNEKIAKKFFDIEVSILSTSNFKDFFEKLLLLIEEKFGIPRVWISIINGSEVSRIIEAMESSDLLKKRLNLIGRNTLLKLIKDEKNPVLVNDMLKPYYKLLPVKRKYLVKSLAIAPLILEEKVIGSLNLGDYSKSRFQPDMDIFFLSQIAVKISICLSNITAREKLKQLATRDSLTGLFNQRGMEDLLEREFSRAKRYNTPLTLLFIDCDNFKMVNDSYGHNCGDNLLQHIAYQMMEITRKEDVVSRFGGDKFVIILPNQTSEKALIVMERLQILLKKFPMKFGNSAIPVSISFGMASAEDPNVKNPASLLKKADKRLYEAKKIKIS